MKTFRTILLGLVLIAMLISATGCTLLFEGRAIATTGDLKKTSKGTIGTTNPARD